MSVKLKKQEFINQLHAQLHGMGIAVTKQDAKDIAAAYENTVRGCILGFGEDAYDSFNLGFGAFKAVPKEERSGFSALTQKKWVSPAHKSLQFTPARDLKQAVKESTSK